MTSELCIGLDVGTTATKGAVYDLDGGRLARAGRPHPSARGEGGRVEQDPEDWWAGVEAVLDEMGASTDLTAVRSVGVCSQVNTHVFVGADGRALRPAITWQDQRCAAAAAGLDAPLDDAARARIFGADLHVDASHLAARAAWVREREPALWERTRWILSPKDWVNLRLTGEVGSDPISSIGLVGGDGAYLPGLDELVPGLVERLPPLGDLAAPLGTTARVGPGAVVARGSMDAWGSVFGSGVLRPGGAMDVAGTSEVLAVASDRPGGAPGVVSFAPWRGVHVHAGPTQAGGDALRWLADSLGTTIPEALGLAASAPAGSGGVVFLPQLLGERAPLWDPHLRAAWLGVSFQTTRAELARAVLEGVAHAARHLLEVLDAAAGTRAASLSASGGGAASSLWCQAKADVLGRPLHRTRERETGVLGAAMMGALAAGLLASVAEAAERLASVERVFDPEPAAVARFDEAHRVYREAQARLADLWRP